ncbi:hypothetical protein N7G274_002992 [Stereocaulon virgatum]|uniref:Uncharacterized protein n=1 Tax=Stereocaulon virgatum TaxID=373712 RepID=A0ABR4AEP0_9LECA
MFVLKMFLLWLAVLTREQDIHLWTVHGGSDLEFKDNISAKRNLKPKEVMEKAKEESRFISKYVCEPKSEHKSKNDLVKRPQSKSEDESKYKGDERYIVDEKFKDDWRRKDDFKPTVPLKPEVGLRTRNKWNPEETLECKDDSKYPYDCRNRLDSIRRVDSRFTERSWRSGVVSSCEKPVHYLSIF